MFSLDGGVRGVVICVYIAALSAAAFLLELGATAGAQRSASRARAVSRKWRRQLEEWMKVFSRLWGRGLLYVFVGTLMASQDSLISLLVGLLDNAVGDADRSGTVSFEEFHAWFAGSADGGLESRV